MQPTLPVILARPIREQDPVTNEPLPVTYRNYSSYANRQDRIGSERLFGDIEAGDWSTLFTVRWPSFTILVSEDWVLYDEFNLRYEVESVTRDQKDRSLINIFAKRQELTDSDAPKPPAPPTPGQIIWRVGWATTQIPQAADLTVSSTGNELLVPEATGSLFLVIWRSDASGGAPSTVYLGDQDFNIRYEFGDPRPLIDSDGDPGQAIVTLHDRNASLVSGTRIRIS